MEDADPEPFDPPAVYCRHFLICRVFWHDPAQPDDGYSLGRIVVNVRPPAGSGGHFIEPRLFAYVQLFGTIDEYDVRVKLVRVTVDEGGGERASEVQQWGPFLIPVTGLDLVDTHAFVLHRVRFAGHGLYDFRFCADGVEEPLAVERVEVPRVTEELP